MHAPPVYKLRRQQAGKLAGVQGDWASRAYEEGAQQRNAKDLDVVLGDQRLLLILLSF